MIRHLVAFRFRDDAGPGERRSLIDELNTFPSHYPAMQRWALGENVSNRDDTFTHAFSVEFASQEELLAYLGSERHERFVRERFRPLVASRAIVSFEVPEGDLARAQVGRARSGGTR